MRMVLQGLLNNFDIVNVSLNLFYNLIKPISSTFSLFFEFLALSLEKCNAYVMRKPNCLIISMTLYPIGWCRLSAPPSPMPTAKRLLLRSDVLNKLIRSLKFKVFWQRWPGTSQTTNQQKFTYPSTLSDHRLQNKCYYMRSTHMIYHTKRSNLLEIYVTTATLL